MPLHRLMKSGSDSSFKSIRRLMKEHVRLISVLLATVTSLPFAGGAIGGIYVWLSPNVMLASVIAVRSAVLLNLLGLVVVLLCLYRKRWFCYMLCPTGWCCQHVSRCRNGVSGSRVKPEAISPKPETPFFWKTANYGKAIALFTLASALFGFPLLLWIDPLVVFSGFFSLFRFEQLTVAAIVPVLFLPLLLLSQWVFPLSWCNKVCPLGGLQDILWTVRTFFFVHTVEKVTRPSSVHRVHHAISRRELLASLSGLLAGGLLSAVKPKKNGRALLPPAAIGSPQFETLCLRCGNCLRACPTQIIKRNVAPHVWFAWMTPCIDFTGGYCLNDCTICGTVCPSGAISPFTIPAKKILPIGIARIDVDKCLLQIPKECDRCRSVCAYEALKIEAVNGTSYLPQLDESRCVGCGACAQICPEGVIQVIKLDI